MPTISISDLVLHDMLQMSMISVAENHMAVSFNLRDAITSDQRFRALLCIQTQDIQQNPVP
uniref:Uncharacterized protein n=1 Tax=Arundo donax TaxID=35708 RepID=A0A0A9DGG6_ARUDO